MAVESELAAHLLANEEVRWSGKAELRFRYASLENIPGAIAVLAIWAVFGLVTWAILKSPGDFVILLLVIPVHLLCAYILVGQFMFTKHRVERTLYTVTNQRVLILYGSRLRSLSLDALEINELFDVDAQGIGTIRFRPSDWHPYKQWQGFDHPWSQRWRAFAFFDIRNAMAVHSLISDLRSGKDATFESRQQQAADGLGVNPLGHLLRPGEAVLWSGRPDPTVFFSKNDLVLVPASMVWSFFLGYFIRDRWRQSFLPFGVLLGLPDKVMLPAAALGSAHFLLGRFLVKWWLKTRTYYAVTSDRVIILANRSATSAYLRDIPRVTLEARPGKRVGSVTFGVSSVYSNSGLVKHGLAFYDIDRAEEVAALVENLRKATTRPRE